MKDTTFRRDEAGMTLVELLVVIVVLGVVGTMVLSGIVTSMRTTARAQDRIDALTELEKGVERIARELRATCQIGAFGSDDVSVSVVRDGGVHRYRYVLGSVLGGGSQPDALYEVYSLRDPATGNFVAQSTRLFLGELEDSTPFAYLDPNGAPAGVATDVSMVEITLRRHLPDQSPIEVRTSVHLRNHGGFTCLT